MISIIILDIEQNVSIYALSKYNCCLQNFNKFQLQEPHTFVKINQCVFISFPVAVKNTDKNNLRNKMLTASQFKGTVRHNRKTNVTRT